MDEHTEEQVKTITKPRIAWFSPVSLEGGALDGPSSYFTRTMLKPLKAVFDIDVISDFEDRDSAVPIIHFLRAFDCHRRTPYDLWVYQLENSRATWFCRMHLAIQPGLVIFHDLLLSDYGPDPMTSTPSNELLSGYLGTPQTFPPLDTFWKPEGPYAYRETAYARYKCFMSRKDISEWRRVLAGRQSLGDEAFFLPYPVSCGKKSATFSLTNGVMRIAYCGSPDIEQRAHVLLEALRGCTTHCELLWLLKDSERAKAQALVKEFECESVTFIENRSPEKWAEVVSSADVAIHLHFSVFGGTGPYLPVSICSGVPVIASEFGDALTLPKEFFFLVQPGSTEVFELREVLSALTRFVPTERRELSEKLSAYGAEIHEASVVASELEMKINHCILQSGSFNSKWNAYQAAARKEIVEQQLCVEDCAVPWQNNTLRAAFDELGWRSQDLK